MSERREVKRGSVLTNSPSTASDLTWPAPDESTPGVPALQACQRGDEKYGRSCEREEAAFVTCSQEHIGLVVEHLVKVADKFCPYEVDALYRCRRERPGDDCEWEDMEAMRCASIRVLAAAHSR